MFLSILGLLPLTWFKNDFIVGGDFSYPLAHMSSLWLNYVYIWVDKLALGLVNSRAIPQFPFMFLLTVADNAGISTAISERILFYFLFSVSGISIYLLVNLLPFDGDKRTVAIFSALFYMFNPFNIVFYWHILDGMIFVYTFLPMLLVLYLQWFKTTKFYYGLLFILTSFFAGYTFSNPLVIPLLWMLLLSFNLMIRDDRGSGYVFKFIFKAGILWSLANGWWLIPLFGSIYDEFGGLTATIGTPWDTLTSFSVNTSFLNLIRLSDLYWAFRETFFGDPYYTYAPIYSSGLFIIISFIPAVLIVLLLTKLSVRKETSKVLLILFSLTLFYLFLAKGNHAPFGEELYRILFRIPFLSAFRAPIHKLGVLISINYALLFGFGMSAFLNGLKEKVPRLSYVIIGVTSILVFIVYPYPLWTGEVIQKGGINYPSFHVRLPDYYNSASEWMQRDKHYFRYYSVPQAPTFNVMYKWENGYLASDPQFYIFMKPGVYSTVDPVAQLPYNVLKSGEKDNDIYKLLAFQNVKYVLMHNDINEQFWNIFSDKKVSIQLLRRQLETQNKIHFVRSFGKLDFFKIADDCFLPYIYSASGATVVAGDSNMLSGIVSKSNEDIRHVLYFSQQNQDKEYAVHRFQYISSIPPTLEFRKINQTKCRVRVHRARNVFPLVFSESYHTGWKAYIARGKKTLTGDLTADDYLTLQGNVDDRITKDKLKEYISIGWVTDLGDKREKVTRHMKWEDGKEKNDTVEKYRINFISRYIQGSIQNDNLPDGEFYETWFAKTLGSRKSLANRFIGLNSDVYQLPDENHLISNGYSNSWIVDTEKICGDSLLCKKNPDGTFDFELVIDFKPQRLFYEGLMISAAVLLGCILYLLHEHMTRSGYHKER